MPKEAGANPLHARFIAPPSIGRRLSRVCSDTAHQAPRCEAPGDSQPRDEVAYPAAGEWKAGV